MKKFALAGAAAAALFAVPALAAQAPQRTPGQPVTRAEMQARVQSHFVRADANRDGFITQAEAQTMAGQRTAKRAERQAARVQRQAQRQAARPAGRGNLFARLDTNSDGSITRAEVEAAPVRANRQGNAQRRAGMFARLDANGDGTVTRVEFDARRGARAAHVARLGGKMFGRADTDRDGRLSLAEATARGLARFERLDSNRDGSVTGEERRAQRAQRKAKRAG